MGKLMKNKKVVLGITALCVLLLLVWALLTPPKSDDYAYQGYITDMRKAGSDTIITVISGDGVKEFTVKRNTKQTFNGEITTLSVGNFIRLSTTRNSETDIKRFAAHDGYSMNGKLVRIQEHNTTFILTTDKGTGDFRLFTLVFATSDLTDLSNGSAIKIYYQYPIVSGNYRIAADVITQTDNGSAEFTEEEVAYITSWGYTLSKD